MDEKVKSLLEERNKRKGKSGDKHYSAAIREGYRQMVVLHPNDKLQVALPYSYITVMALDESGENAPPHVKIETSDWAVWIFGRGLDPLFHDLTQHKVSSIRSAEGEEDSGELDTFITEIAVNSVALLLKEQAAKESNNPDDEPR